MEKDGELSEDDSRFWGEEVQQITDDAIAKIDETLAMKDEDIKRV